MLDPDQRSKEQPKREVRTITLQQVKDPATGEWIYTHKDSIGRRALAGDPVRTVTMTAAPRVELRSFSVSFGLPFLMSSEEAFKGSSAAVAAAKRLGHREAEVRITNQDGFVYCAVEGLSHHFGDAETTLAAIQHAVRPWTSGDQYIL